MSISTESCHKADAHEISCTTSSRDLRESSDNKTMMDAGKNSGSLQDLIKSFDCNVKTLLSNLSDPTDKIAPVQIRSPEEVMTESEVWWTLTGTYGNLPPIDFNKTQIRKRQIDALGLSSPKVLFI
jgi:hypothetical protein